MLIQFCQDWKWVENNQVDSSTTNKPSYRRSSEREKSSTFKIIDGFFIPKTNKSKNQVKPTVTRNGAQSINESKNQFKPSVTSYSASKIIKNNIKTFSSPSVAPIINQSKSTIQSVQQKTSSSSTTLSPFTVQWQWQENKESCFVVYVLDFFKLDIVDTYNSFIILRKTNKHDNSIVRCQAPDPAHCQNHPSLTTL